MCELSAAWLGPVASWVAVAVNVGLTAINIREGRRSHKLPHRIKAIQDKIRENPLHDLNLTHGKLTAVHNVLALDNIEHVAKMISSAEEKVRNQNTPPGYRLKTQEEQLLENLVALKQLLEEQAGMRQT